MDLTLLVDITNNYEHEEEFPFHKNEISFLLENMIDLAGSQDEGVTPEAFISSLTDLNNFLGYTSVHLTEMSLTDSKLRVTFTSGLSKEAFVLEMGVTSHNVVDGYRGISVTYPDGNRNQFLPKVTVSQEFGENVLHCAIKNSNRLEKFSLTLLNNGFKKPWVSGGTLRNIDYVIEYGSGPEVEMIKSLTGILNKTDNQVVLGNLTGETDMVWRAYGDGKPSLDVAPGVIATFLTNDYKVGHGLSMATLRHIYQQIQHSHGSLAALRPLRGTDDIRSNSKLVKEPEVVSMYLAGANVDEVEHTIEMLERKGFNQETLPEDVYSALQSAHLLALSATEGGVTTKKTRMKV